MEIQALLIIIWLHFFSDFILQSQWMGVNKSKDIRVLMIHGWIYTLCFLYFGIAYAIINGLLHTLVDFVSSRITSKLYKKRKYHWFFVTIGADQAIHMTMLIVSYILLKG